MIVPGRLMLESKPFSHPQHHPLGSYSLESTNRTRQQNRMALALILLVFTLASVVFHDRDFWLNELQVQDDTQQASLAASAKNIRQRHSTSKAHRSEQARPKAVVSSVEKADMDPNAGLTRMALPSLEVEVVAANSHRKLRLGSNIVQVDLERLSSPVASQTQRCSKP
jgi:hypothetical protein